MGLAQRVLRELRPQQSNGIMHLAWVLVKGSGHRVGRRRCDGKERERGRLWGRVVASVRRHYMRSGIRSGSEE